MPDITISLTPERAARAQPAVADYMHLEDGNGNPRAATMADVERLFFDYLKEIVLRYEKKQRDAQNPIAEF